MNMLPGRIVSLASCIVIALAIAVPVAAAASATASALAEPSSIEALPSPARLDGLAEESVRRWQSSEHGGMLMRILPQHLRPSTLPDPTSEGARLTALYCVQCHYLPNPAMHEAGNWDRVVARMLPRMRGEGNMGELMARMMLGPSAGEHARPLAAPSANETRMIVDYLRRNAMKPIADSASPTLRQELASEDGRMFVQACNQCHVLPDPAQHSASEWPDVLGRMQRHMRWMNR
ncbi:MAG TPA: hypothetical protein PK177_22460, partial [Burkholderiaceae bacterium]|nr:hypothetical protein [Burkholderiaceae bacterium]